VIHLVGLAAMGREATDENMFQHPSRLIDWDGRLPAMSGHSKN